jgi:F-type H+-transporting ATPase subunit gamma
VSETTESLGRKIRSVGDLQSVVRTMKAVAASSIGQYETSVRALVAYDQTVQLGLGAYVRQGAPGLLPEERKGGSGSDAVGAIVFGSDQGLVGRFNEVIADYATKTLAGSSGRPQVWAVGERVYARLADAGLPLVGLFAVPMSVGAIAPLVGRIQIASEARRGTGEYERVYVFHNRPKPGSLYEPACQRLLPLDAEWVRALANVRWPTGIVPEVMGGTVTLRALIREYLFITLFRACAESLASENASRLAAMERADRNIDALLVDLHGTFHRLRQNGIDAELFDVISGFGALAGGTERLGG